MHELYQQILVIHPDTACIRIVEDDEILLVFPKQDAKYQYDMTQSEFITNSPTDCWFEEAYNYLNTCRDNGFPIAPGDYR